MKLRKPDRKRKKFGKVTMQSIDILGIFGECTGTYFHCTGDFKVCPGVYERC